MNQLADPCLDPLPDSRGSEPDIAFVRQPRRPRPLDSLRRLDGDDVADSDILVNHFFGNSSETIESPVEAIAALIFCEEWYRGPGSRTWTRSPYMGNQHGHSRVSSGATLAQKKNAVTPGRGTNLPGDNPTLVDACGQSCILRDMNKTDKKDLEGFAFIRNQLVHFGTTPSLREIGSKIGYRSPRSVQLMLDRLEHRGLIKRIDGVIRLSTYARKSAVTGEQVVDVPLVGAVACGLPSLARQAPEALISISTKIARPGSKYFLLRASGSSMNRAGIQDGDLVLVRQQPTAEQGDRIVALINDDATIKRFYREGDVVVLRPDSTDKTHRPIVVSDDLIVQGVVVTALPSNLF